MPIIALIRISTVSRLFYGYALCSFRKPSIKLYVKKKGILRTKKSVFDVSQLQIIRVGRQEKFFIFFIFM